MSASNELSAALDTLAGLIAAKVVEALRSGDVASDMVDQSASPLGRRRHINAVRRLVAEGAEGAAVVGRRYLLSRERLSEELARPAKAKTKAPNDGLAELRALLGDRRAA